jgi:hypothetical protein
VDGAPNRIPPEHPARIAARELTAYLRGIGIGHEDRALVAQWLALIGAPDPRGYYGRDAARRVALLGFVPVAPRYWDAGKPRAKAEWIAWVREAASVDKPRSAQWLKLINDSMRG